MFKNTLYYGDNLDILRKEDYFSDNSIDLIYLDPPFKSGQDYNVLFEERNGTKSAAQIKAFEDTWQWDIKAAETYQEIVETSPKKVADLIKALRSFLGQNDMMAYLVMMAIRLVELHRVLKDTGSIYLHCDPTASHYLKLLMDSIFGKNNFKNEIIWHYRKWSSGFRQLQRNHDVILFYSKTDAKDRVFNIDYMERTESTLKRFGKSKIISGHDESGRRLPSQVEDEESQGVPRDDVWDIARVPPIKQLFPTQKPELLLRRIIKASTKDDSIILDPFCGCGTTIVEAEDLKRNWIGIDITHLAISLIKHRLKNIFGTGVKYEVIGLPVDLKGAEELAKQKDRYPFQWWALGLVEAWPMEKKKGKDKGIDGSIYFHDDKYNPTDTKAIIIQVKSGKIIPSYIRELKGVLGRENAQIGVFITLKKPTRDMKKEALSAGFYKSPIKQNYPKIQILTIESLLKGEKIKRPPTLDVTFKKAKRKSMAIQLKIPKIDF